MNNAANITRSQEQRLISEVLRLPENQQDALCEVVAIAAGRISTANSNVAYSEQQCVRACIKALAVSHYRHRNQIQALREALKAESDAQEKMHAGLGGFKY